MNIAMTENTAGWTGGIPTRGRTPDFAAQQSFAGVLGREDRTRQLPVQDQARVAAEDFVAQALVQPVLKQFRAQSNAAAPFAPTSAEQTFRGQLDADLAKQLVKAGHWPLVDRIAADLLRKATPVTGAKVSVDA